MNDPCLWLFCPRGGQGGNGALMRRLTMLSGPLVVWWLPLPLLIAAHCATVCQARLVTDHGSSRIMNRKTACVLKSEFGCKSALTDYLVGASAAMASI